jgi:hypothetical protein
MIGEFVPYNRALKLKQLGFDKPCFGYYQYTRLKLQLPLIKSETQPQTYMGGEDCSAPTFSQAFRWFIEVHGLHGFFDRIGTTFIYKIRSWKNESTNSFSTYEEAELACLVKLIEIVELKTTRKI